MEEKDINRENEKISLELIIEKAKGFISGEVSQEDMASFGGEMTVRSYIPILEKMTLIMTIVSEHIYSIVETQEVKTVEMYKNIFFYIMLSGYAGIDCTNRELITYSNYDLLYPIFAPFILSYCKDDYELIISMLKDSINFYNIKDMNDGIKGINESYLKEVTESNSKLIDDLNNNKDLIHELNQIAAYSDPITKDVINRLQKVALEDANAKIKETE